MRNIGGDHMVIIRIDPVAWSGGKVMKYRAMSQLINGHNIRKCIYGDPMPNKPAALDSLYRECKLFQEASEKTIIEILNKKEKNGISRKNQQAAPDTDRDK